MTVYQKKKVLQKIAEIEQNIDVLKEARLEAMANGYASASISSGGGSKSFSRFTPEQYSKLIAELERELRQYMSLIVNGTTTPFRTIATIWS